MSETDSTEFPPVGELQLDSRGLTAWRPAFDGIEISLVLNGVKLRAYRDLTDVAFDLTCDEARHLANCLNVAAERRGAKDGGTT